jgi:hypothetical protein
VVIDRIEDRIRDLGGEIGAPEIAGDFGFEIAEGGHGSSSLGLLGSP